MKIKNLLVKVCSWVTKFSRNSESKLNYFDKLYDAPKMTGRKLEHESDSNIPEKKLCTDKDKELEANGEIPAEKKKKKKVALLLGYCGTNYYGMQLNCHMRTIEMELLKALFKANCIPEEGVTQTYVTSFQRAARTDKGVSAAKQVVSLKLATDYDIAKINSYLPEDIKVFSVKRTTKGFNSKQECVARTYSYTLPTYALAPEIFPEFPKEFRISQEMIDKTNNVLSQFLGSKVFHNFTTKKYFSDPSSRRYIMSFKAGEPFVDGIEFITLTIKGQSFMLYQIRKMVGYTIGLLKGLFPPNFEVDVWSEKKFSVPVAPSLGLILENIHYDRYNKKFGCDGVHECLFGEEVEAEVEEFKKTQILPCIIKTENENYSMFEWLKLLPNHVYDFSERKEALEIEENKQLESDDKKELEETKEEPISQQKCN